MGNNSITCMKYEVMTEDELKQENGEEEYDDGQGRHFDILDEELVDNDDEEEEIDLEEMDEDDLIDKVFDS